MSSLSIFHNDGLSYFLLIDNNLNQDTFITSYKMTSRFVQVSKPTGDLEVVEREIPEPGDNQVRIKIQACGVCHSDSIVKEGLFPGIQYPRVPGHEVAGVIDIVGKDVME